MYPPALLYQAAQRRQAEELRHAEQWRRTHPEVAAEGPEPVVRKASPHRHWHVPAVLAVGWRH